MKLHVRLPVRFIASIVAFVTLLQLLVVLFKGFSNSVEVSMAASAGEVHHLGEKLAGRPLSLRCLARHGSRQRASPAAGLVRRRWGHRYRRTFS